MRKLRSLLCLACLVMLVPLLLQARERLPVDPQPLVAEKYAGWSGVLRLWVFEGWPSGDGGISPWLNRCIAGFERGHPGVYVQPRFVDDGAITSLNDSGILPPDMVLFPPGLLDDPAGLMPLEPSAKLRLSLSDCVRWGQKVYAVPVAMGGYLWAWNAALLDALPDSWRESDAPLSVPAPERWRRWDAALLALCSGRYSEAGNDGNASADIMLPGLDLGLSGAQTPAPSPTPIPDDLSLLPRRLPKDFQYDADAWRHFINGEAAAMPVTQREIRRLQALSNQGKGPDWRLARGDAAFTDQLLCLAVVDQRDAATQQALCVEFLDHLLSDECQQALHFASAIAVTDAGSGYTQDDPLATLEAALQADGLTAPRCFGTGWIGEAEGIVRNFISDSGEAPFLWRHLRTILGENPNN